MFNKFFNLKSLALVAAVSSALILGGCGSDNDQVNGIGGVPGTSIAGNMVPGAVGQVGTTAWGQSCTYVAPNMCIPVNNTMNSYCSGSIYYQGFMGCPCATGGCPTNSNSFIYNSITYYYITPYFMWPQYYTDYSYYSNLRWNGYTWAYLNAQNQSWMYWNNNTNYWYQWNRGSRIWVRHQ